MMDGPICSLVLQELQDLWSWDDSQTTLFPKEHQNFHFNDLYIHECHQLGRHLCCSCETGHCLQDCVIWMWLPGFMIVQEGTEEKVAPTYSEKTLEFSA